MGKKAKLELARKESNNTDSLVEDLEIDFSYEKEKEKENEEIEQEYFRNTVLIIKRELQKFVEENALSLCEYTDDTSLSNFVEHVLYQ